MRAKHPAGLLCSVLVLLAVVRLDAATVSGFIKDGRSGEPLAFATAYLSDRSIGTASDRSGYYVLDGVAAGTHTVVYSIVGYRPQERRFTLARDGSERFDARLEPEPIPVSGVTVSAARQRFRTEGDVSVRRLDARDLKIAPAMIEQDLFRSLQMLPGVVAVSDFSSALYVRGGSPDQNLVLLDGVTVYNPYHIGGLFSTFNLDALSNAELHAGAFPAAYGGAISSVLDVEMKQGNSERYSGRWDVGLLTSKLLFEGPIPKGSFLVAGRRTYIDAVTWTISRLAKEPSIHLPYYFYDLQAKANLDLSSRDRLTISGYSGDDVIYFKDSTSKMDFRWGNYTLALKWRHIFSPKVLATTMLSNGRNRVGMFVAGYPYSGSGSDTSESKLEMVVGDFGLKEDFTIFADSSHTLKLGGEARRYDLYDYMGADTTVYWNLRDQPGYFALYAADRWEPLGVVMVNAGLRGEYFTSGHYFRVSPRLSAKYFPRDDVAVSAGWGVYYQYLSIPFPRDEMIAKLPATFFQQWIPAGEKYEPPSAIHYVLGGEKWFGDDVHLGLETYYKSMDNLLETGSMLPGIFGDEAGSDTVKFSVGSGWAAGAELLLRRNGGWVGYGLAFTRRSFDSASFYPIFDARHNFNVAWTARLGRGWNLNLQWLFRSGFPYTGPIGQYQYVGEGGGGIPGEEEPLYYWMPLNGRRGNYRLPAYHRLDVGLEKGFKLFGADWTFYFQVINAYAQKNVLWYNYMTDEQGRVVREPFTILPIPLPSFGVRGGF
jgi:hypothetical protein